MRSEDDVGVEVGVSGESVFMTIDDVICISVFLLGNCHSLLHPLRNGNKTAPSYRFVKVSSGTEKATTA